MQHYPILVYPCEEGGFVAEVPTLKGCLAQGETIHECLTELETVIDLWLETARNNGISIPTFDGIMHKLHSVMTA